MPTDLSRKVHGLMAHEMGPMGKFILKKQCQDLGLDMDELENDDLLPLSKALVVAVIVFTGQDKARKIEREIRKMIVGSDP